MEYTLTQEELTYLCWLRNKYTLPGLGEKPLGDLTPEQTTAVLATVERTLLARNFLSIPMPGKPVLEPELERCISTACDAHQIILLTKSSETREPKYIYLYIHNGIAVKHTSSPGGVHFLKLFSSSQETQTVIYEFIAPISYGASMGINIQIAESVLFSARDAAQNGGFNAARASLTFNGIEAQQAALIATMVSMPIQNISMLYSDLKTSKPISELHMIETHLGTWMFTMIKDEDGINWIQISQVNKDLINKQVAEIQ